MSNRPEHGPRSPAQARRALLGIGAALFVGLAMVIFLEIMVVRSAREKRAQPSATRAPQSAEEEEEIQAPEITAQSIPAPDELSLEEKVGQLLLLTIPRTWTADDDEAIGTICPGAVIILKQNVRSRPQVAQLSAELRSVVVAAEAPPPLIFVDHDGAKDSYLHQIGLTAFPSNATLGRRKSVDAVRNQAEIIADDLRSLDVDATLAPVLDVLSDPNNTLVGKRSYGPDPEVCAALGAAFVKTLAEGGVVACAKHWPGCGAARPAGEGETAVADVSPEQWRAVHRVPFARAIDAGLLCLMTANVAFPALDASGVAATFSPTIVGGLLRAELGFEGVVLSHPLQGDSADDLAHAALRAVSAGVDMIYLDTDPETQMGVCTRLLQAAQEGQLSASRLDRSVERILELKRKLLTLQQGEQD